MTNAIILAAGLGSRILPLTKDKPKSLIEFAGKSLLENQIELFRKNGIQDISIVTGYNKDKFSLKDVNYFENLGYEKTNTLLSLFCAKQKIMNSTIISYADIIFEENILKKLLNTQDEISLVNDRKWLEYWEIRPDETSDEATETVYVDQKNCVKFIGKKTQNSNAHFIGLMKLQNSGTQKFLESFEILKKNYEKERERIKTNLTFNKLRIADLLQMMIKNNVEIKSIPTDNGWLEFDTINDLNLYNEMYEKKSLQKFIKL